MTHEGRVRRDPNLRAERFVDDWTALQGRRAELGTSYQNADARKAIEGRMKTVAQGLGRDAQVESILRGKTLELGLGEGPRRCGRCAGSIADPWALYRVWTIARHHGRGSRTGGR